MRAPTHDSIRAKTARLVSPGFGYCYRCGMPWNRVEHHTTWYEESKGCFPLCENCWALLGCPEARIEYYKILIDDWELMGSPESDEKKRLIQKAVANGK